MSNSSIWLIDRTLSSTTTLGLSGPGSNGNVGVLYIPQSSSIAGASPSDCLESFPGYSSVVGHLTPLQRCSRCILQSQPTGLFNVIKKCVWCNSYQSRKWIPWAEWCFLPLTFHQCHWKRHESISSPMSYVIVWQTRFFSVGMAISLEKRKLWIQASWTSKNWPCVIHYSVHSNNFTDYLK